MGLFFSAIRFSLFLGGKRVASRRPLRNKYRATLEKTPSHVQGQVMRLPMKNTERVRLAPAKTTWLCLFGGNPFLFGVKEKPGGKPPIGEVPEQRDALI